MMRTLVVSLVCVVALIYVGLTQFHRTYEPCQVYVDFLSLVDVIEVQEGMVPGMSLLVDRGYHNIKTGLYELHDQEWIKVSVPTPDREFLVMMGQYAGQKHSLRHAQIQTQYIFDRDVAVKSNTSELFICLAEADAKHIKCDAFDDPRLVQVSNMSPFGVYVQDTFLDTKETRLVTLAPPIGRFHW